MEQVAEALKQLRVNNKWNQEFIDAIEEECDCEDINIWQSEIESVLNAIISIYEKKAPIIEWHAHNTPVAFTPPVDLVWNHDVTGELYDYMYFVVNKFPEHANKWTDGKFGGKCFEIGDEQFITTEGVRGIGYKAVIAFDENGNGIVFFRV